MPETVTLLTTREVAQRLRCSERSVERRREVGDGPPFVKHGKKVLYPEDKLGKWLETRTRTSTSEPDAPAKPRRNARATPGTSQPQIAL
jgi:hypothetical protein